MHHLSPPRRSQTPVSHTSTEVVYLCGTGFGRLIISFGIPCLLDVLWFTQMPWWQHLPSRGSHWQHGATLQMHLKPPPHQRAWWAVHVGSHACASRWWCGWLHLVGCWGWLLIMVYTQYMRCIHKTYINYMHTLHTPIPPLPFPSSTPYPSSCPRPPHPHPTKNQIDAPAWTAPQSTRTTQTGPQCTCVSHRQTADRQNRW